MHYGIINGNNLKTKLDFFFKICSPKEAVKLSLSRSESNASLRNKKPKKGQSTAKQRLGKILKLKF